MTKRSRFLAGLILGLAVGIGAVAYATWTIFYNHIMDSSEALRINVDEIAGTNPLQVNITVQTAESAPVIRTVTTTQHEHSVTVFYHLALSGLMRPSLSWGESYRLTVPDSVNEVRFGRSSEVIWQRSAGGR